MINDIFGDIITKADHNKTCDKLRAAAQEQKERADRLAVRLEKSDERNQTLLREISKLRSQLGQSG